MLLCGAALLALAGPGAAQVQLRVTAPDGTPVPSVRVEVSGTAERSRTVTTAAAAIVDLGTERWADVRRISLSHLGFETLLVQRDDLAPLTVLRLEPAALPIEGLTVGVEGSVCALDGSEEARALWAAVASRYSRDTGRRPLAAAYRFAEGPAMSDVMLQPFDPSGRRSGTRRTAPGRTSMSSGGPLERMIGYSWPGPRFEINFGARHLARWYPSLEMWDAYHFSTETFGARHDFRVLSERGGVVRLAFCPRDDVPGTTLSGEIHLVPDRRFVEARWRFHVKDGRDEEAGGMVTFETYREGRVRPPHLLAERGIFYRHSGREPPYPDLPRAYYREVFAEVEWRVLPPNAGSR